MVALETSYRILKNNQKKFHTLHPNTHVRLLTKPLVIKPAMLAPFLVRGMGRGFYIYLRGIDGSEVNHFDNKPDNFAEY